MAADMEEELVCRRATLEDATAAKVLIGDQYREFDHRYGQYSIKQIIETSYFSVTVTNARGDVIGFAAFHDCPGLTRDIPSSAWVKYIRDHYKTENLNASNTLWMVFFVAAEAAADAVINHMFATLYTTLPDTDHVLYPLPAQAKPFSPVAEYFTALNPKPELAKNPNAFAGDILWSPRVDVIPDLVIRRGKVEDYDDLMPLLLAGSGVLTKMGDEFYLEELLEHQDPLHCVLVAEDSETQDIVGLMCMSSSQEDQHYIVKHFSCEPYQKLKRWHTRKEEDQVHGNKNSFRIDFFYLNGDYECRAVDFLRPAFREFPFAEYCYIRLPHSVPDHTLLSKFQYVPLKQGLTLKDGCFLATRYAMDDLEVRAVAAEDVPRLTHLLSTQSEVSRQLSDQIVVYSETCCAAEPPGGEHSLCLLHKGNVIGSMGVTLMTDQDQFQFVAQFDVDSKIDFLAANPNGEEEYREIGLGERTEPLPRSASLPALRVKHFYIKPIFRCHTRTFLRECLRLLGKQVLYYSVSLEDEIFSSLMVELTLALPRRQMHRPGQPIEEEEEEDEEGNVVEKPKEDLRTLHFTSRRLLSETKTKIHSRVVIIGASTTGLSFIYTLLSLPYMHFSNIVLISRDGLPEHPNRRECNWFTNTLSFLEHEYILFQLKCKVRVIEGSLVDFERTEKYVVTDNGFVEPYDHLVITAGRQYTVPKEFSGSKYLARNGVFPLSSQSMLDKLYGHVRDSEIYEDDQSHCVIYGNDLDSYCVMTALLQLGVRASRLVLVSPTSETDDGPFKDNNVETKVDKLCESLGIKIYKNHEIERVEYNEDRMVAAVYLANQLQRRPQEPEADGEQRLRSVELPCTMLVYAQDKDIDPAILSALNKRSIVFDGRVIVENNYRTTDKQIFAAGPIAMFSRRFGPSEPFETYSSMEVGRALCHTVLGFLGLEEFKGNAEDEEEEADGIDREQLQKERRAGLFSDASASKAPGEGEVVERPKPLPIYKENMISSILLPNDYHYFHCQTYDCSPRSVQSANNISTEDEDGDSYLRVSVNTMQYIQSISYLGSSKIEEHNFKVLVGLPQTYLNIVQRWDDGLITDVVQFLRQNWTMAIYYDKFMQFSQRLKQKFTRRKDIQMLSDYVMEHVHDEGVQQIEESRRKRYAAEVTPDTEHMIQLEVIRFMHQNKEFLPIYFLPDVSMHV